jgi:hypothetical protein
MRIFLIALLLIGTASAQPDFSGEDHLLRVAFGDIPTTSATETAGAWNFQEVLQLPNGTHYVEVPGFAQAKQFDCSCTAVASGNGWDITLTEAGAVTVTYRATGDVPFAATVNVDGPIVLFAPQGTHVESSRNGIFVGPTTEPTGLEIYQLGGSGTAWFTVDPIAPSTVVVKDTSFGVLELVLGLMAGLAIWAFLVQRGLVQKRQRKQIAGVATHKEIAKVESPETLDGRKRVLMAGLKELELAKMNQEMETPVYDTLKADFKKQTVAVMRAIEESKID